jgi:hypothetical protein
MVRLNEKSFRCRNLLGDVVTVKPYWTSVKRSPRGKTCFRDRYVDVPRFGLKAVIEACGRGEEVRCPVQWYCKKLDKIIIVSEDAFPHPKFGFVCDCGQWLKKVDPLHTNFVYGVRVIV